MRRTLIVAAVTGLCLIGAGPAWAVFPGQNGRIAYTDFDQNAYTSAIHTVLPSGQGDTVIGQQPGERFLGPTWSPNGRRIAFVNDRGRSDNIYTMRADGSDVRQLTFGGLNSSPSYALQGGRIVFLHIRRTGGTAAVTMRTDGSHRHTIATFRSLASVTWSPAGKIAYQRSSPAGKTAHQRKLGPGGSIWTMRPDGTHRHRVVSLGSGPTFEGGDGPFYSPNGHKFIFTRCEYDSADAFSCDGFLARANGSHVRPAPCGIRYDVGTSGSSGLIPLTYSPEGNEFLVARPIPGNVGVNAVNVIRLALPSCAGHRVVVGLTLPGGADWQALSVP